MKVHVYTVRSSSYLSLELSMIDLIVLFRKPIETESAGSIGPLCTSA